MLRIKNSKSIRPIKLKEPRKIKALVAVTGSEKRLGDFEDYLKGLGAFGSASDNNARRALDFKWLVVYGEYLISENGASGKLIGLSYAYRSTNCKDTSRPKVLSSIKARKLIDFYTGLKDENSAT